MSKRINVGPVEFGKKKITVGQEKIDKKNKFDQKKFSKLMWEKKSYLKELLCWNKSDLTKCANCISLEKFPKNNKRRAFNKAIGPGKKNAKLITVGPTSIPYSRVL